MLQGSALWLQWSALLRKFLPYCSRYFENSKSSEFVEMLKIERETTKRRKKLGFFRKCRQCPKCQIIDSAIQITNAKTVGFSTWQYLGNGESECYTILDLKYRYNN